MISYLHKISLERQAQGYLNLNNKKIEFWSQEEIYQIYKIQAIKYYQERINSILRKYPSSANFNLTSEFLREKRLVYLSSIWENSGIFVQENLDQLNPSWHAVCSPAAEAIIMYVSQNKNQMIEIMASDENAKECS